MYTIILDAAGAIHIWQECCELLSGGAGQEPFWAWLELTTQTTSCGPLVSTDASGHEPMEKR